jgi:hypothetical protein
MGQKMVESFGQQKLKGVCSALKLFLLAQNGKSKKEREKEKKSGGRGGGA